jgi:hypothetical protein
MSVSILVVDDEPDVADLFGIVLSRESKLATDRMTAYPACPIDPRDPGKGRIWGITSGSRRQG